MVESREEQSGGIPSMASITGILRTGRVNGGSRAGRAVVSRAEDVVMVPGAEDMVRGSGGKMTVPAFMNLYVSSKGKKNLQIHKGGKE